MFKISLTTELIKHDNAIFVVILDRVKYPGRNQIEEI